jgi:hypothetical protein
MSQVIFICSVLARECPTPAAMLAGMICEELEVVRGLEEDG